MAQVYSFVDENGATRLFAEIHPDPAGTPFNGGTITGKLTVAPSDTNASPLFEVDGAGTAHPTLIVDALGIVTLDSATAGVHPALAVKQTGTDGARVSLSASGALSARGDSGEISLLNTANSKAFFDVFDGLFGFTQNAVPPDGNFDNNGMCALWLDATPGATKLMIKALDSAGTARTASISLA